MEGMIFADMKQFNPQEPTSEAHCKFFFLIAKHYLWQRREGFSNLRTEFMLSDHILYSHAFSDSQGVD